MPSGKLQVTAVTMRGLAENGLSESRPFVGCFVDASEKQRTQSAAGPEPQWNQTLTFNVSEGKSTLNVEVVNEDQNRPGVLGGGSVDLNQVFQQGRAEQWVNIASHNGEQLGHLYINLVFT
ncbi:C2 domain-containing protein [Phycomyces blakesleeanus]|uniref:C2 domain-containing protein n=1 Tax=Phycomyces blakesleeanus TaxID=4837 RepID=A0ABR3B3Q8_PHYBL